MTTLEPLVYTVDEVMRLLRIEDRRTVYAMIDRGELRVAGGRRRGKGHALRISRASVHAWAEGRPLAPDHDDVVESPSRRRRAS